MAEHIPEQVATLAADETSATDMVRAFLSAGWVPPGQAAAEREAAEARIPRERTDAARDALEAAASAFPAMIRKMWSAHEVQAWLRQRKAGIGQ